MNYQQCSLDGVFLPLKYSDARRRESPVYGMGWWLNRGPGRVAGLAAGLVAGLVAGLESGGPEKGELLFEERLLVHRFACCVEDAQAIPAFGNALQRDRGGALAGQGTGLHGCHTAAGGVQHQ